MKKILSILLSLIMVTSLVFVFVACGGDNVTTEKDDTTPPPIEEPEETPDKNNSGMSLPAEAMAKINEIYSSATIGPQTIRTVHDLAILTSINYNEAGRGPISVTPARLNGEDVTLVTLGGTQFVDGQATTIKESQLAAQGKSNDYLKAVTKVFEDGTIPTGKPVIVTGISLGGMIAQQVIGVPAIKNNFKIRAIITFGSPLTMPLDRKGIKVVRFADSHDQVPSAGEIMLNMFPENRGKINQLQNKERIVRTSKYIEPMTTHGLSYIEDDVWLEFDFMGDAANTNVLETLAPMQFYHAPKLSSANQE